MLIWAEEDATTQAMIAQDNQDGSEESKPEQIISSEAMSSVSADKMEKQTQGNLDKDITRKKVSKRKQRTILTLHEDIIKDSFWIKYPYLLQ